MDKSRSSTPSKIPKVTTTCIPKLTKSKEKSISSSKKSKRMESDRNNDRYPSDQSTRYNFESPQKAQQHQERISSLVNREKYKSSNTEAHAIQSDFSKVFRSRNRQLPDFGKDFGPDGTTVLREVGNLGPEEDISAMFQRPNTAIPTIPRTTTASFWNSRDSSRVDEKEATIYLKNQDWQKDTYQPIVQSRISGKNPSNYNTPEELDSILAKYANKVSPRVQNEYQVYQGAVSNNYPILEPRLTRERQSSETPYMSNADHTKRLSDTRKENKFSLFESPLRHQTTEEKNHNTLNYPRSQGKHAFPFRETADGDLLIHPDQVAFESKTLSVLVSDPSKVGNIKAEKIRGLKDQDHLLKDIEEVIQKGLCQLYDKNASLSTNQMKFGNPVYPDSHLHWKNLENEYLDKEIMSIKYSEAKVGTDKLMTDMHQRIQYGKNADTHVMIGNKVYPCHSIALEVVSKFFDNLSRPKETVRRIDLPESEVSSDVFPTLMDWILQSDKGRAAVITKSNVVSLFSAGKYLDISELKSQCVNFLQEKVETNDRHLMHLWEEVKQRPNCQELMVVISSKAAVSFQHIYKERKFLNLDVDEIVMLLSSDDIVIESELDVYDTAIRWLLQEWDTRKVYTNQVMSAVRFGLLTPLQLTQIAHSPELSKYKEANSQDYAEVLAYGSVKSMIDDGLAYSIYHESYKNQPEEIQKWIEYTGIRAPRPRTHLNSSSRNKTFFFNNDSTELKGGGGGHNFLERNPSYTVIKETEPDYISRSNVINSTLPSDMFETNEYEHRSSRRQSQNSTKIGSSKSFGEKKSKTSTLEDLANSLRQPIKEEDIDQLTRPSSRSSSKDSDKYSERQKRN